MEESPKVEVCSYCSGFDVNELKKKVKAKISCIGKCSKKNPELQGKVYGFLKVTIFSKSYTPADMKVIQYPSLSVS